MSDMAGRPDQAKECPIGKIECITTKLKTMAFDALELSMGIESFLLGQTPEGKSEAAEKKSPNGWLDLHWEDLKNIKDTLSLMLNCLRSVKNISK